MWFLSHIRGLLDQRFLRRSTGEHDPELMAGLFGCFDGLCEARLRSDFIQAPMPRYKLDFSADMWEGKRAPYSEIYWESNTLGFVLLGGSAGCEAPIACIGFTMNRKDVSIVQLQGVSGMRKLLRPIKWELLLLDIVIEYARLHQLPRVMVLPAHRNFYNPLYNTEFAEKRNLDTYEERAEWDRRYRVIYDENAIKRGFHYDHSLEYYVLDLETAP